MFGGGVLHGKGDVLRKGGELREIACAQKRRPPPAWPSWRPPRFSAAPQVALQVVPSVACPVAHAHPVVARPIAPPTAVPALALAVILAALALTGCGGVISPDLFLVTRSGAGPEARLTLLVNEEGVVRCNGGRPRHLSDPQIIEARVIQEGLQAPASRHEAFPAARGSVLSYYVRDQEGAVSFADNSPGQPAVTRKLAAFVLSVAQTVCGLPQQGA